MKPELLFTGEWEPRRDTILFIPGGMTSPAVYDGIDTPPSWRKVCVDWTMSPGPWDVRSVGQRIAALIGEKRRGKTVLAGYSAGGVIAMIAALRSGPGVSGLLLSNTGLNTQSHGDPQAPQKIRSGLSDAEASAFIDSCFYYPVPQPLKQKMLAYIKNAPPEAGYQAALSLRETDLREEAAGITCPVIIAHGIYDKRRLKEHALEMNRVIKHSRIIWLEGGHTIMVDDGEGYAKALTVLAACSG